MPTASPAAVRAVFSKTKSKYQMKAKLRITRRWLNLLCWIAATVIFAHSPHVVMFDLLSIPSPDNALVPTWPRFIDRSLSVIATILFYKIAEDFFGQRSLITRCVLLASITAMLNQDLLRNFIMNGVVSHDWLYCFVETIGKPLEYMLTSVFVVGLCRTSKSAYILVGGGVAIAAMMMGIFGPSIDGLVSHWVASLEYLDTGNIYNPPYGWQVDVPSYLTFLEPVIACFAVAALTWSQLSRKLSLRWLQFALLVMCLANAIVPTLIFGFYQDRSLTIAILSEAQFGIQSLVMALMTAAGWQFSQKRSPLIA